MEKIIAVYWFAILFIVAAACVYFVFSFSEKPYDVREIEANFLINKIVDCISKNGILDSAILSGPLLEICHLTFNTEEFMGWNNDQFFFEIFLCEFNDLIGQGLCFSKNSFGNQMLKQNCEFASGKNYPYCLERNSYFIDDKKNKLSTKILAVVRKTEKND